MLPAEIVRRSAEYLRRHGVESPNETAEALMMRTLRTTRTGLYARTEGLDLATARRFGRALCQRCRGIPLQYLTGEQQFLDLRLHVEPGVFVPRPETEGLALAALASLQGLDKPVAVDVGTGTGAIALFLKHRRPDALVIATDASEAASLSARSNAEWLALDIEVFDGDLLDPLPPELRGEVDLIVSNPPYVTLEEYEDLPAEVKAEPYEALVGGTDVHRRLVLAAAEWLKPGGYLFVEIGAEQGDEVRDMFEEHLQQVQVQPDLAGRDRVVHGRRP
jgi:release factor glutamine methyltransferase